eukprot:gene13909-4077_t
MYAWLAPNHSSGFMPPFRSSTGISHACPSTPAPKFATIVVCKSLRERTFTVRIRLCSRGQTYPDVLAWAYPDWYLAASPVVSTVDALIKIG